MRLKIFLSLAISYLVIGASNSHAQTTRVFARPGACDRYCGSALSNQTGNQSTGNSAVYRCPGRVTDQHSPAKRCLDTRRETRSANARSANSGVTFTPESQILAQNRGATAQSGSTGGAQNESEAVKAYRRKFPQSNDPANMQSCMAHPSGNPRDPGARYCLVSLKNNGQCRASFSPASTLEGFCIKGVQKEFAWEPEDQRYQTSSCKDMFQGVSINALNESCGMIRDTATLAQYRSYIAQKLRERSSIQYVNTGKTGLFWHQSLDSGFRLCWVKRAGQNQSCPTNFVLDSLGNYCVRWADARDPGQLRNCSTFGESVCQACGVSQTKGPEN